MKALLILLFVSLAKGDKLNPSYLPPNGAKYSGGGDIEVPFEVPVNNFGTKDDGDTRLTPGIFREGGVTSTFAPTLNGRLPTSSSPSTSGGRITSSYNPSTGRIISSTYAPTTYPSTNFNSYSTTSRPNGQTYEINDGPSIRPNSKSTFSPNQYSDKEGGNLNSPVPSETQFDVDADSGRPVSFGPAKTGDSGEANLFNNNKDNTIRYPERKIRPQEEAEKNAVILNYENVITPDGFAYSFDTSNGIHADESGTASDGVKANGSYSYIGDDGKLYNVTYSADEYGFQPRGDHLPTPPPVPDAILKVIEQAARDRDNGVFDDGSYDENKYGFKKYQPGRNRILGNNGRLESTKKDNGLIYDEPSNISGGNVINQPDGRNTPESQRDYNNNEDQKGTIFIEPKKAAKQTPNGFDDEYYENENSQKSGFPSTIHIPGNKINIFNGPRDRNNKYNNMPSAADARQKNRNNYDSQRISDPQNSFANTEKVDGPEENKFIEQHDGYSYPNPIRQFSQRIPTRFDQNKYNDQGFIQKPNQFATGQPIEYYSPSTELINDYRTDTVPTNKYDDPSTERLKDFGAYTGQPTDTDKNVGINQFAQRPTNSNTPSSDEGSSTTFTDRPRDFYSPSTSGRLSKFDTDRTGDDNSPSLKITPNERIKPTDSSQTYNIQESPSSTDIQNIGTYYNGQPNYRPESTENSKEVVSYTGRPNDYFNNASTGGITEYDTITGKPSVLYGPSSSNRIFGTTGRPKDYFKPAQGINKFESVTGTPSDYYNAPSTERKSFDIYTDRPNEYPLSTERTDFDTVTGRPTGYYYGPSSTGRINNFGTPTGKPTDYYSPSSTERINNFGTVTGRPTNYYSPSSTERINNFGTATGRPDYYGPSSTERIKVFDTATSRPDYYAPSSTERINNFGTATGRPDYNGPSSTERKNNFGTATGRPNYYAPSSTERINNFGTATGRPDYNGPSSTERKNNFGTATGRPNYYGPSSTERVKVFDAVTGRPLNYYSPSSTAKIKDFGTITGKPTDYYGPSSTERVKVFDTATGRPTDYYSPSATERTKIFDTATGRPTDYYGPSSTERINNFGTATGRPDYYTPSSTERIKVFDTATGRPTDYYAPTTKRFNDIGTATSRPNYYAPSSTESIIGEDFSGPKQPQRYDPETGYHY